MSGMRDRRPNIVVFFTDQQRADTCGCYGAGYGATPRLDAFAEQGTVFERMYTCQPVCGPARAAIQSGVYPTKTGCYRNAIALPEDCPTIAKHLNAAGYRTGYVGKWHLATTEGAFNYETAPIPERLRGGYRDFWIASDVLEFTSHGYGGFLFDAEGKKREFTGYRPDCVTDMALEFLNAQDEKQPFFLFLSHIEPHHQNDRNRFEGPEGSKERFANVKIPGDLTPFSGNYREQYPDYLGAISALDANFGRVLDALAARGLSDNTVVIFTSDHGCHFRTRNREYKRSCHDASIHIPFVIGGGAFAGGGRCGAVASLIDLPATILSAAGVEVPRHFDGKDLAHCNERRGDDAYAFLQISEDHVGRAVRNERYTYEIAAQGLDAWRESGARVYEDACLYDNESDPYQLTDRKDDPAYAAVKEELRGVLRRKIRAVEGVDVEIK